MILIPPIPERVVSEPWREFIDNAVCLILYNDGPDRHIDGHEVITEFVVALLEGTAEEWIGEYQRDGRVRDLA